MTVDTLYEDNRVPKFRFKVEPSVENGLKVDEEWDHDGITVRYVTMKDESLLGEFSALIESTLSEPYTIFTYRYFWTRHPELTLLAYVGDKCVGVVISTVNSHHDRGIFAETGSHLRGYVGMLAVDPSLRGKKVGTRLVEMAIDLMWKKGATDVVLDAEASNIAALRLYTSLGFIKTKKLNRYYLNNGDAFRLKLVLPVIEMSEKTLLMRSHATEKNAMQNGLGGPDSIGMLNLSFALPPPGGRLCTFSRVGHAKMEERAGRKILIDRPQHGHGGHGHSHEHGGCCGGH